MDSSPIQVDSFSRIHLKITNIFVLFPILTHIYIFYYNLGGFFSEKYSIKELINNEYGVNNGDIFLYEKDFCQKNPPDIKKIVNTRYF